MGTIDHLDEESDFDQFLQEIIDHEHLEGAALGVTKLVIAKGKGSLSDKQSYLFKKQVEEEFITSECARCGGDIPWCEMYAAYDNGNLCGWCDHMSKKDD